MNIRSQISMVFHLDKCIGCHTCSLACKNSRPDILGVAMSQENVQLVRGLYEAIGKGDVATVLGKMDEAIEWREAENFIYADRNPYVGPQAVLDGRPDAFSIGMGCFRGHAGGVA